jgi:hypothetical protein
LKCEAVQNPHLSVKNLKFFYQNIVHLSNFYNKSAFFKSTKPKFSATLSFFHNFQQLKAQKIHFLLKNSKIFNKFRNYILPLQAKTANFSSTFYKISNSNSGILWQTRH